MTGYEYGNARIHAMKARLLTRKELEVLLESGSLQGLIAALTRTTYHTAVETALTRTTGMDCVSEALHVNLIGTLGKTRTFFSGPPAEMVSIVLRAYDIHNLKTILRGLFRNVPTAKISSAFIPVGELDYATLIELTNVHDLRTVIDRIVSQNLLFAQPLLRLRTHQTIPDTLEMELALERWHFQEAARVLGKSKSHSLLKEALALESDLTNLLTVLRFAYSPTERGLLRERVSGDYLAHLLVGPGHLSFAVLTRAGTQDSLESAVACLAGTAYESALKAGLESQARTGRLSSIEKELRRYRLNKLSSCIPKDPLGIGVLLGYFALKVNEVNNIRWIAQGISLGLKTDVIRAELEYAG